MSVPEPASGPTRVTPPWRRLLPHLLLGLALLIAWNFWLPEALGYLSRISPEIGRPNWDFYAYYVGGKAFDRGLNPYLDHSARDPEFDDVRKPGFSRYIYPPTILPLLRPLSRLDYDTARYLWAGVYFTVYLLGLGVLLLGVRREHRRAALPLTALLFVTCHPLLLHIRFGQIDALVAGLLFLALASCAMGRRIVSAVLLAVATLIKVSPAVLLIYFVLGRRDRGYLLAFVVAALGLVALSLLAVPVELYRDYVTTVLPDIGSGAFSNYNQSIFRLVGYRFGSSKIVPPLVFALLAGWTLRSLGQGHGANLDDPLDQVWLGRDVSARQLLVFFLNMLIILLFSPICWMMTYVWVVPFSALLLAYLLRHGTPITLFMAAAGVALMSATVHAPPVTNAVNLIGNVLTSGACIATLRAPTRAT
jgi:hypothetical protein